MNMGLTAEYLAAKYRIPREKQDEFALRSHQLAAKATTGGEFNTRDHSDLGPRDEAGRKVLLTRTSASAATARSRRSRRLPRRSIPTGGSVTAGNSSPINVGAAALLVMSEEKAQELGLKPIARIRAMAVAGVNPEEMGIGPVPAIQKALQAGRAHARSDRCIELNEAFAVQVLACLKLLGIDEDKVNRGAARSRSAIRWEPAAPGSRPRSCTGCATKERS